MSFYSQKGSYTTDEWRKWTAFLWVLLKYCSVEMSRSFSYEAVQSIYKIHLSSCLFTVVTSPNRSDLKCTKLRYEAGEIVYIPRATPWEIEHVFPDLWSFMRLRNLLLGVFIYLAKRMARWNVISTVLIVKIVLASVSSRQHLITDRMTLSAWGPY